MVPISNLMLNLVPVLAVMASLASCQGQAWPDIQTGKVSPITSFSGNPGPAVLTYDITHNDTGANLQACLALISYNAILSTSFSFNTTVMTLNGTNLQFRIQTYNTTYFNVLSYHYLISTHPTLEIHNLCYYTSSLYSGNGTRSVTFANATTAFNGSFLHVSTVLSGVKVDNLQGTYLYVDVSSAVNNYTLETTIRTEDYNLVEWGCLSVIAFNGKSTLAGQFYVHQSSTASHSAGLANLAQNDPAFLLPNIMFFGISTLRMNQNQDDLQIFIMNTDNSSDPLYSPTINPNQVQINVWQLYIWEDTCVASSSFHVPLSGYNCTVGCTAAQYNDTNQYCLSCGLSGMNCLTCDNTQCLSCDNSAPTYRYLDTLQSPNVCLCLSGYFQLANGTCSQCSTYITNCLTCSSYSSCSSCNTGFVPENGLCVCATNTYLTNGTCIPLKGCLNYYTITNAYYCTQCDTSHYFQLLANQTCDCMANTAFNNVTGMCEGACADGASLGNLCDLGAALNGAPGSGCQANCTVAPGYYCSNPQTTSPSVCVPIANYTGSFLYVTKQLSANTANIYVQLQPNEAILAQMDFSTLVTTSIPTTAIACQFDSTTGILLIKATYSQSIEGATHSVNVSFDTTKRYSPSVELYQKLEGVNAKLEFGSFQTYNNMVYYVSLFVGGFALVLAIIAGIVGYKMVGFEIVLPVQVTYFTLSMLGVPYSALSSLYGLSFSTGYNQIASFELLNNLNLDKGLIVLQRNYFFLQNCNYTYIPLAVVIVMVMAARCFLPEKTEEIGKRGSKGPKKKEEESVEAEKEPEEAKEAGRCQKCYYFMVDKILVNLWVILLLLAVFSFGVQVQTQSYDSKFNFNLNIAAAIGVLLVQLGGLMFIYLKIKQKDRTVTFRSYSRYYPLFYIFTQMSVIIIIICTYYATQYGLFVLAIPEGLVIFFYVKLAPHGKFKSFVSITGFYTQLLPPVALTAFIIAKYMTSSMISTIAAFAILALFLVAEGFTVVRLVIKYRDDKSRVKEQAVSAKVKMEAENLEAMTYSSIKNQLMNNSTDRKLNWEAMNESKLEKHQENAGKLGNYEKIEEKGERSQDDRGDGEDDDEDELRKLKMRLKKEIFQKRNLDL